MYVVEKNFMLFIKQIEWKVRIYRVNKIVFLNVNFSKCRSRIMKKKKIGINNNVNNKK